MALKLSEPDVDPNSPWGDDLLSRQTIAKRLTGLVATQGPPLSISLHGQWGTGKTFMLKRWQKDLENQGFKAMYFNAWEDDFCDDPLLAILGQMAEHFKEDKLNTLVKHVFKTAVPLLKKNALSVLHSKTGITFEVEEDGRDILDEYLDQRRTKNELKNNLTRMAQEVSDETSHPLVFIVDELDRCRPTFAIELLERVKHIFDVPRLVFVFGLNRDELSKSLQSVYGEIDSDIYLRRFFDFEFNLSEIDSQGFARHLIERFQIGEVFRSLESAVGRQGHMYDYENFSSVVPPLWSALGLSLRDIDYGIRLLALLARSVPLGVSTHPFLLSILIVIKFKNSDLYHLLLAGSFRTSEIMDYVNRESSPGLTNSLLSSYLDRIEGFLYCADVVNSNNQLPGESARKELSMLSEHDVEFECEVVSKRAQNADRHQLQRIIQAIYDGEGLGINGRTFGYLATLIDSCHSQLRR